MADHTVASLAHARSVRDLKECAEMYRESVSNGDLGQAAHKEAVEFVGLIERAYQAEKSGDLERWKQIGLDVIVFAGSLLHDVDVLRYKDGLRERVEKIVVDRWRKGLL